MFIFKLLLYGNLYTNFRVIRFVGFQALKSYGLIDLQQGEPYDDIILKLTPAISKAQI